MSKNASIHSSALLVCVASAACLTRPVASTEPTTKSTFAEERRRQAVDKIDILLAIDNSSSMKDKQAFLADAVPKLVERLVTPNCVKVIDDGTSIITGVAVLAASGDGECAEGAAEFRPITDIHVGIVSSSLGNFGATASADVACAQRDADDHAQLTSRGSEGFDHKIEAGNFLAWFPVVDANEHGVQPQKPYADRNNPGELSAAFAKLVVGVGDEGCGLEAQLESMYQFLIAPQPWNRIVVDAQNRASYEGINAKVLQQRSDFLRPDSLVAVIMLTDEDDSSVDPLSVGGQGHLFMNNNFPQNENVGTPTRRSPKDPSTPAARGTAICATDPGSPECTSCAFGGCPPDATYHGEEDQMNVRFFDMKRRFGVDPQYPIARYVRGLTASAVPSRDAEHGPNYGAYDVLAADCTNPLFAGTTLPTDPNDPHALCKIGGETRRDPSLVFFALVGGVPNDLLTEDARSASGELTADAWTRILGSDPGDYKDRAADGKDARMVQSITPRETRRRTGLDDTENDPLNTEFRDWNTDGNDLQYACTFPLPVPTPAADSLDCVAGSDAPLCAEGSGARAQVRAKAYPSIREAWLVRELHGQGVLASLCPQNPTRKDGADYGYAPAVNDIVDRLKNAITAACVPRPLERDASGKVPCLMLELMPPAIGDCTSDAVKLGRSTPAAGIVDEFKKHFEIPAERTVCQLAQDTDADTNAACQAGDGGWCYLEGNAAGRCAQQIVFNDRVLSKAQGSRVYLQCINQYSP